MMKEPMPNPAPAAPADQPEWLRRHVEALCERGILNPADAWQIVLSIFPAERADATGLHQALARQGKLTWYQAALLSQDKADQLVVGNYVLLDKIGQGGFGAVYKARHRRMQRLVALKILLPELTRDPQVLSRFQREVETLAKLSHPNIVIAHDADAANGVHFLAMEFVDGADLGHLLRKQGAMPPDRVADYVAQAARGLDYAHAAGIVHRDIKPNNLLLDRTGVVKVSDLGLARIAPSVAGAGVNAMTATQSIMGTADYMAPEQAISSKKVDHRADIYSLGCTLYSLLTARVVYPGDTAFEILIAHRESPIPKLPENARTLQPIFERMVAKRPEDRYPSMAQVVADLERHGTSRLRSAAPPSPAALPIAIASNITGLSAPPAPPPSSAAAPADSSGGGTNQLTRETAQHALLVPTATVVLQPPASRRKRGVLLGGIGVGLLLLVAAVLFALSGNRETGSPAPVASDPAPPTPGAAAANDPPPGPDLHALIRQYVEQGKVGRTNLIGAAFANGNFEELPTDGGILIGFEVGLGQFVANDSIGYLRPIYQTAAGEKFGKEIGKRPDKVVPVKARLGYAVGGLRVAAGGVVDGMAVTFMKRKGNFLDTTDSYESPWLGGSGAGQGTRTGGDGSVAIGLLGKTIDGAVGGLGLIYPRLPTGWIVLFRSDDPSIWNTDVHKGDNHFARSLELVPASIRYLKLTNTASNEFVVLEMTRDRLSQSSDEGGRYGWEGSNHFHYQVYHLGAFFRIWPSDGDFVIVTRHGRSRGWGFGDLANSGKDGVQGYSWEGKTIPKTIFEIAVTADDLTDVEAKKLLKAGVVRP